MQHPKFVKQQQFSTANEEIQIMPLVQKSPTANRPCLDVVGKPVVSYGNFNYLHLNWWVDSGFLNHQEYLTLHFLTGQQGEGPLPARLLIFIGHWWAKPWRGKGVSHFIIDTSDSGIVGDFSVCLLHWCCYTNIPLPFVGDKIPSQDSRNDPLQDRCINDWWWFWWRDWLTGLIHLPWELNCNIHQNKNIDPDSSLLYGVKLSPWLIYRLCIDVYIMFMSFIFIHIIHRMRVVCTCTVPLCLCGRPYGWTFFRMMRCVASWGQVCIIEPMAHLSQLFGSISIYPFSHKTHGVQWKMGTLKWKEHILEIHPIFHWLPWLWEHIYFSRKRKQFRLSLHGPKWLSIISPSQIPTKIRA